MEYQKDGKAYKIIMTIIVTALITALVTTVVVYNFLTKTNSGKKEVLGKIVTTTDDSLITKMEYIKSFLQEKYVGTIDEEKMIEGALQGYVNGLGDKYTEYLSPDDYETLMISVAGNYVGIGIYMAQTIDEDIIVIEPIEDSPAAEAGLKTGDIIVKVNGEACHGVDSGVVASRIKGEAGSKVELEILREKEAFTIEIERREIEIKVIDSEVLENNIGYIELLSFDSNCSEQFKTHLDKLLDKGIKSLIIDLRGNGGGVVSETINMAEMFIPKGKTIMKTYDKQGNEEIVESQSIGTKEIKLVVLVNGNSASASEIFAAAIKDNKIGTLVGTKTYGKGCMQSVDPLTIGGALKITIEEFRTPNGDNINNVGIEPDVEIKNDGEEDLQLQKAIELLK